MKKRLFLLAGAALAAAIGAAQAEDVSYGPLRFGVSGGSSASPFSNPFSSPYSSNTGRPDSNNPIYQSPLLDRANAAPSDADAPKIGAEGGGTPMSRGGVNDTLTGYQPNGGLFTAPAGQPKDGKAKSAKGSDKAGGDKTGDKGKTADAKAPDAKAQSAKAPAPKSADASAGTKP